MYSEISMKRNYHQFFDNCWRVKVSTKSSTEIVLNIGANRTNIITDIVLLFLQNVYTKEVKNGLTREISFECQSID